MTSPAITAETVELLQTMIRNGCVNDGTPSSGFEHRNADTLHAFLGDAGFDVARFEPTAGRVSLVARMEGREPGAASLCLMGHTDVVPVNPEGWTRDPFGGELVDGPAGLEVWGRGAIDMLNLTASMAVAFRQLAARASDPEAISSTSPSRTRSLGARTARGGWPITKPMRSAPTTCSPRTAACTPAPRRRPMSA